MLHPKDHGSFPYDLHLKSTKELSSQLNVSSKYNNCLAFLLVFAALDTLLYFICSFFHQQPFGTLDS